MKKTTKKKYTKEPTTLESIYKTGLPSNLRIADGIVEKASNDKMKRNRTKKFTWSGVSNALANGCLKK